jgi:hypothetical protein
MAMPRSLFASRSVAGFTGACCVGSRLLVSFELPQAVSNDAATAALITARAARFPSVTGR